MQSITSTVSVVGCYVNVDGQCAPLVQKIGRDFNEFGNDLSNVMTKIKYSMSTWLMVRCR